MTSSSLSYRAYLSTSLPFILAFSRENIYSPLFVFNFSFSFMDQVSGTNFYIYQDKDDFSFGIDAVLLSDFTKAKKNHIDLCRCV